MVLVLMQTEIEDLVLIMTGLLAIDAAAGIFFL